ncbi:MAG: hypothetical protein K1X79_08315 [Oligoflexia bacterium]|nr:hypothetical protein [Oligoflexia bacterium]
MDAARRLEIKDKCLELSELVQRKRASEAGQNWKNARHSAEQRRNEMQVALRGAVVLAQSAQPGKRAAQDLQSLLAALNKHNKARLKAEESERGAQKEADREFCLLKSVRAKRENIDGRLLDASSTAQVEREQAELAAISDMAVAQSSSVDVAQPSSVANPSITCGTSSASCVQTPDAKVPAQSRPVLPELLAERIITFSAPGTLGDSTFRCSFESQSGAQLQLELLPLPAGGVRVFVSADGERERRRLFHERERICKALRSAGYASVDLRLRSASGGRDVA